MAVAALLISILALVTSGVAAWYARDQARSAAKAAEIETERHTNELADRQSAEVASRTALMSVTLERTPDHRQPQIILTNRGLADATKLSLTFLDALDGKQPPMTVRWECPNVVHANDRQIMNPWHYGASSGHFEVRLEWLDGRGQQTENFELGSH